MFGYIALQGGQFENGQLRKTEMFDYLFMSVTSLPTNTSCVYYDCLARGKYMWPKGRYSITMIKEIVSYFNCTISYKRKKKEWEGRKAMPAIEADWGVGQERNWRYWWREVNTGEGIGWCRNIVGLKPNHE